MGHQRPFGRRAVLPAVVGLLAGLAGPLWAQEGEGWARSQRYTLLAGPRGNGGNTQIVFLVDDVAQLLFVCEYTRGKSLEVVRAADLCRRAATALKQRIPEQSQGREIRPGYALVAGIPGASPAVQTLYVADDGNELILVYEYDTRSHALECQGFANLHPAARKCLAARHKGDDEAETAGRKPGKP
jgi:hypothetical protein